MIRPPPRSTLFPSPPLFRSPFLPPAACCRRFPQSAPARPPHPHSRANRFSAFLAPASPPRVPLSPRARRSPRSEEHTSELQSRLHLVCRLLLEKKKLSSKNA